MKIPRNESMGHYDPPVKRANNDLKLKKIITEDFKSEKEICDESSQSLMRKAMKLIENS